MKRGIELFTAFLFAISAVALSDTIHVPADQPTIQAGIDAASEGDTVLVAPGTYTENLYFNGKSIAVRSSGGSSITVIDGDNDNPVVTFSNKETVQAVLDGFRITNGKPGGIRCTNDSHPVIENNTITENSAKLGAGIYCYQSSPVIRNNRICDNAGEDGVGIFCSRAYTSIITNNTICGNIGNYSSFSDGGGIYCEYSSPTISNNLISDNKVNRYGGGINCRYASPVISGNTITGNETESLGGGIYSFESDFTLVNSSITRNSAGEGGALLCDRSDVTVENNTIKLNSAHHSGGGMYFIDSSPIIKSNLIVKNTAQEYGGGLMCSSSFATVTGNIIRKNTADVGGGIHCIDIPSPVIMNNLIEVNTSRGILGTGAGGGICCRGSSTPIVVNNMFRGNIATGSTQHGFGGGIYCGESMPVITNNTLYGNEAAGPSGLAAGGGIYCDGKAFVRVANTILWNNSAAKGPEIGMGSSGDPSTLTVHYSDVMGGQAAVFVEPGSTLNWCSGMIDSDPLFVDEGKLDFHLTYPSPCRNTGDNQAPGITDHDFEGDPRIVSGMADMGADEFSVHLYCTGQATPGGKIAVNHVGWPGTAPVFICLGSGVLDPPIPTAHGAWYLAPPFIGPFHLPQIPPGGVLDLPATLPASWSAPYDLPMQALVGAELTNHFVLEVR